MSFEMAVVFALLLAAVVLFATERLPVDLVALLLMAALLLSRIVTPQAGIAGFSNEATVTVGAMFVLSAGLFRSGAANAVGALLARLGRRSVWLALVFLMVGIAAISAFVNNTAAVALFLPIVLGVARESRSSASRLLMPLSFASMFGGVCTLIGTSTNILVSAIAVRHGYEPFGMFEFAPLGLAFFAAGTLYMLLVGVRLIPDRRPQQPLISSFGLRSYLTEVVLKPEAASVGKALGYSPLVRDLDIDILELVRGEERLHLPPRETILHAGDVLRVRCHVDQIKKLQERIGVALRQEPEREGEGPGASDPAEFVEAVVAPNSPLVGRSLKDVRFRNRYGATALAIRHRNEIVHENLETARLSAGDTLLLDVRRDRLEDLRASRIFVLLSEVELPRFRTAKILPAALIVAAVVAAAATAVVPIVVGAIAGCVLMVLTGCITLEEAYGAVDWKVIFLLAGVLTLGVAMESTGAATLLAELLLKLAGNWGPVAVVGAFYLLTSLLTEAMSNNAAAALLAPVAIASAAQLGVDPKPLLMAVTFAASASFMTPVGYQTNTLIYGPGNYRFSDFARVGAPLNLLFLVIAALLIPRIWPL